MPPVSVPNVTGVCVHLSPCGILSSRRTSVVHPNDLFLTGHICSISVPPPRPTQSASAPAQPLLPVPLPAGAGTAGNIGIAHSSNFPCEPNPCVTALSTKYSHLIPLERPQDLQSQYHQNLMSQLVRQSSLKMLAGLCSPGRLQGRTCFFIPSSFWTYPASPGSWPLPPPSKPVTPTSAVAHTPALWARGFPHSLRQTHAIALSPPASARTMLPPQGP